MTSFGRHLDFRFLSVPLGRDRREKETGVAAIDLVVDRLEVADNTKASPNYGAAKRGRAHFGKLLRSRGVDDISKLTRNPCQLVAVPRGAPPRTDSGTQEARLATALLIRSA